MRETAYTSIADRFSRLHNFVDVGFNQLYDQLDRIEGKIDTMAIGQGQLDADLQALLTEVGTLADQVAAALNKPGVDLSTEDATVKDAITRLQAIGAQASGTPTP